jgi:putative transposase
VHEALRANARQKEGAERVPAPRSWTANRFGWRKKGSCWGYASGKKITGRKRHLLLDTLGLILAVVITAASECCSRCRRSATRNS